MHVSDIMSRDVKIVSPEDTLEQAAKLMAKLDIGILPVGENDRLVGMISDRDIVVRAVAAGKSPKQTKLRGVMTPEIKFVYEDESVEDVARNMSRLQVRRLPVLSRAKRLVGIVSLCDLAIKQDGKQAQHALKDISQPVHVHH
jgi:CBS domain-containing protein